MKPHEIYKAARARAQWCLLFLAAYGIVAIVSIVFTVAEINLLQRIESGGFVSEAEAVRSDNRQGATAIFYLLVLVATIVTFLMWLHRASSNLASLGWESQLYSPGWAVGWWFIPIANLFRPYQVVREVWQCSLPGGTSPSEITAPLPTSPLLGPWWVAYLISGWVGNSTIRVYFSGDASVADLIMAGQASVAADAVSLVALAMVVPLIWQITANQDNRHRRLLAN